MRLTFNLRAARLILGLIVCALNFQACQSHQGASEPDLNSLPAGQEIVNRYREVEGCRNARLKLTARLTEEDGTKRTFTIMTYYKCVDGTQYSLQQLASSNGEAARALLSIERPGRPVENVTYLPGFQKFVELEDLSREDALFGLSIQESLGGYDLYRYRLVATKRLGQHETYEVEGRLKPTADSRFTRTLTFYRQDNFLPLRMELYDRRDRLVRVRRYTDWAQIDGHWTVMRTEVDNRRHKKQIVFETVEASYDVDEPLSFFSRENLKKLILNQS